MDHRTSVFTTSIHGGRTPERTSGAINTPIFQSTTYVQHDLGTDPEYAYSRVANPTVAALEKSLSSLEGGRDALCFGSGMAATTTLGLALLQQGDRVVCTEVVYGGTHRLLRDIFERFGVVSEFVDTSNLEVVRQALRSPTALLILESPANPTLRLADVRACCDIAGETGARVVVDNTFPTPALQQPLELGADLVLHSTTKYLDGHNATIGGALVSRDPELLERLHETRKAAGTIQSPMEAFLTLQGIKTLAVRMEKQSATALAVARMLADHPGVNRVHYPFLSSSSQFELARRQQVAGGAIVTFELHGGLEGARRFVRSLKLFRLAENLGSVESLVTHPATMTHASVPEEERLRVGITAGLIRISVGLEDPQDILTDIIHALSPAACAAGGAA